MSAFDTWLYAEFPGLENSTVHEFGASDMEDSWQAAIEEAAKIADDCTFDPSVAARIRGLLTARKPQQSP